MKVVFVCLGNICRSPAAEAILKSMTNEIEITSRGIDGYHVGEPADPRMREAAMKKGITIETTATLLTLEEMLAADYILVATEKIARHLKERVPECTERIFLISHWSEDNRGRDVPDPYYSGDESFDFVIEMLQESLEKFYKSIPL